MPAIEEPSKIGLRVSVCGSFEGGNFFGECGTIIGTSNDNDVCVAFDNWTGGHNYIPENDNLEGIRTSNNLWYLPFSLCYILPHTHTSTDTTKPYYHIIKKIKQMELSRHAQGYKTYQL